MKVILTLILMVFMVITTFAKVQDYGTTGDVYNVIEKDFDAFVSERANAKAPEIDRYIEANKEKMFKPHITGKFTLPPAKKDSTRYFVKEHVLQQEIFKIDAAGQKRVIYPKGFKYNPLDYMHNQDEYIIVNANRRVEVNWLKSQDWKLPMVMISEGDAITLSSEIGMPVYLLTEIVSETFGGIKNTPTVVQQEGNRLRIQEFFLSEGRRP